MTIGPRIGPIFHGPQWILSLTGSFRRRLCSNKAVGIAYDVKNDAVVIDTIALKAALLPMLMRASRRDVTVQTRIEYNGRAEGS